MHDLTPTVLIAEDDLLAEVELEHALGAEGCRVVATKSADAAMRAAETNDPDIAIVDLELGAGADGIGLAHNLSARGVPTIAVSNRPGAFVREALSSHPAAAILPKPLKLKGLLKAIRKALAAPPR